jgi:hypothetical protein
MHKWPLTPCADTGDSKRSTARSWWLECLGSRCASLVLPLASWVRFHVCAMLVVSGSDEHSGFCPILSGWCVARMCRRRRRRRRQPCGSFRPAFAFLFRTVDGEVNRVGRLAIISKDLNMQSYFFFLFRSVLTSTVLVRVRRTTMRSRRTRSMRSKSLRPLQTP